MQPRWLLGEITKVSTLAQWVENSISSSFSRERWSLVAHDREIGRRGMTGHCQILTAQHRRPAFYQAGKSIASMKFPDEYLNLTWKVERAVGIITVPTER